MTKNKGKIKEIADKYHIKLILLFGSFADGTQKVNSDYDIAVLGYNLNISDNIVALNNELTKVFNKTIDLSIINQANPLLKFQIAKNSKLLFGSEEDYTNFKVQANLEYMDNKKFFDMELEYVKNRLKTYDKYR